LHYQFLDACIAQRCMLVVPHTQLLCQVLPLFGIEHRQHYQVRNAPRRTAPPARTGGRAEWRFSMSPGGNFSPLDMTMISFRRPVIVTQPWLSDAGGVAGVQPAFAIDDGGGGFRVIPVTEHVGRTSHQQGVLRADLDFDTCQRRPHGDRMVVLHAIDAHTGLVSVMP